MSPSAGHVPRTPDRRSSSSALFGAFRALTGGRIGSPTPPLSSSSATETPIRRPSPKPLQRPDSVTTPPANSADAVVKNEGCNSISDGGKVVIGGPPELGELVAQMEGSHSFPQRAEAIRKVCRILEEYPIENVLAIWSAASDLLAADQHNEAVEVGYELLKHCVALPSLTALERNGLFRAVSRREGDKNFDKRLEIISILTNSGRNVEAVETSIAPFIVRSLDTCFKECKGTRDKRKPKSAKGKQNEDQPVKEAESMERIFQFTINVCKFTSRVFSEEQLEQLLSKVMSICQETTQTCDMENSIRLFDTIVTYVHIPPSSLQPFLEILCAIHRQIPTLQEQAWNALCNMFKSHVGKAAVGSLLHSLLDGPRRMSHQYSVYRGVMLALEKLLAEDGDQGLPKVPISLLFPALKASIKREHQTQEGFVLKLISTALSQARMRELFLHEADWSDMIYIVRTCAERDDDREAANAASAEADKSTIEEASTTGTGTITNGVAGSVNSSGEPEADIISTLDLIAAPSARRESIRRNPEDSLTKVLVALDHMTPDMDFVQKTATMELFMQLANRLTDSTAENMIKYYAEERYLHPSNGEWLEACRSLVIGVLKDKTRPRSLRIMCIKMLRETYSAVQILCASDTALQCAALLMNNIEAEEDVEVLHELVDFAVEVADEATDSSFPDTIEVLKRPLERQRVEAVSTPAPASASAKDASLSVALSLHPRADFPFGSPCNVIATALVRLFIRSVPKSAKKTLILYDNLREIAGRDDFESDARLTALKLLFRLRADSNHALIVSSSSEGESIATVLCRTSETAVTPDKGDDSASIDSAKAEDRTSWYDQRKAAGSSPHSSLNRHNSRSTHATGRISKPVPPLWMYPGPKGLPEEPAMQSSRFVYAHIDPEEYPLSDDLLDMQITLWLELTISLLQKALDWEIYSYVLIHLGPQLSNQALVRSCVPQLKMMRSVICDQLRGSTFKEPPGHTLLKKADVAVCLFHILTILISYHDHFEKSEEDDLVKTFLHGIGNWDRTSTWCIHALTVCCQETPLSMSKSLDSIIQKMSQIITKPSTAIHILEFLTSLARMPELYKNFREDEFKTVFGVSFRYLQHVRDQRERQAASTAPTGHKTLRHSGASRDFAAAQDQHMHRRAKSAADDLPQYVYSLAYHVITFWFMGLKMEERPKFIPWISRSLLYTDQTGRQIMEEQGQVIVDLMNMVAYSDRDGTTRDPDFAKPTDGEVWKKTWLVGHSIVTIETAARTGVSLITSRRPCGTKYISYRPLLAPPPRHQIPITVGLASEAFYTSAYVGILPDDVFQTFYAPLNLVDSPIPLPEDDTSRRAIEAFDRNSTVDGYKVGVIYIGEGQTAERDIFMNDIGSAAYTSFLNDLGTLVQLKGAKFNTGGLDTRDDVDGEFTICWRDRCIELVFHITTMMPTDEDADMTYANKKRHIGNDCVNIIFNDSGLPYNFNTFPSAFNYVYIVISPESHASFLDRRFDSDPDGKNRYYKVQVISKPGFPDISPAVEPKILCGKHLAAYCRLIAINASVFSQVWIKRDGGESISFWRNRLREIKRLRERHGAMNPSLAAVVASPPVSHSESRLSSPPARNENATGFKHQSVATFISEGTSRSSLTGSSPDM
ncbi:tuberin [Lojkania enalia]|uniref:Tuberin n=1 Tax=Lojkania enalia TaxID=147567 RepID=A0A9P4K7S5_9PLEO|nr:tuberin [Didymosphaeria enalia]